MATIGEAVLAAIAGRPGIDPGGQQAAMNALAREYGSASAAARAMDVPRSTWRGWLAGRTPRGGGGWLVDIAREVSRRSSLDPAREARMRAPWSLDSLTITGTYNYRGGGTMKGAESRSLPLGDYMNDIAEDLVDAYLNGADADELGELFVGGIADNGWYAQTFREDYDGQWDIQDFDGWGN